jgi:hypothetical protein
MDNHITGLECRQTVFSLAERLALTGQSRRADSALWSFGECIDSQLFAPVIARKYVNNNKH